MYNLAVLISGNGSNLQAIIDEIKKYSLSIRIACVFSDRQDAFGLERAKQAAIPTRVLNSKKFPSREAFDEQLLNELEQCSPDLVVLAGFMRILTQKFVQYFQGRLINIHPSLLPHYKGLHTHEKVLAAKEKEHGATVHLVTEDLDGGPILAQSKLTIEPNDTMDSLKNRVHLLEHRLYPQVIRWFAEGKFVCTKEGVFFEGRKVPEEGVLV